MMLRAVLSVALGLAVLAPAAVHAQSAGRPQNMAPDTVGTGPYPAVKEVVASLPGYVVYRPRDLKQIKPGSLGVYLFGNGGCEGDGAVARMHLLEIASHGFVAIAPGGVHSGPGSTPRPPRQQPNLNEGFKSETPVDALDRALDWVLAENNRQDSPLHGLVNGQQIAASGHSCGGLQALHTARDPRVNTVVMMNSGLFPDGSNRLGGMAQPKSYLASLRGSVLYVLGGPGDIAYQNGMDDFNRIQHIPVAVVDLPVGHHGTFDQPNGGKAAAVTVDWLKWQLRGVESAASQFRGPDCGLCKQSGVEIKRKQLP